MAGRDFEERVLHIVRRQPTKCATVATIAAFGLLAIASVGVASAGLHPQVFTATASTGSNADFACAATVARDTGAIEKLIAILGDDRPIAQRQCYGNLWSPARSTFDHPSPGEQAAIALAAISRPSLPHLVRALDDSSAVTRRNAAWAIGELRGGHLINRSDALVPLIRLTSDRDAGVRRAAAFSLSELKSRDGVDPLIALLSDDDARVRAEAAYALGEIGDARASALLHTLKDHDPDAGVRRAMKWALHEIED
jgi:HEAT repeat protein